MNRVITIRQSVMEADEEVARRIRDRMGRDGRLYINIIGSPGSGKTTLLESTIRMAPEFRFAVIEGDIATARDAERIAALGVPSVQINTDGGCHLEAHLVSRALESLPLDTVDILFVENVGNLVCPAEFDIGEDMKVAVSSVPEGADKPLKYPLLFSQAKAVLLTKTDLLPYVPFEMELYQGDLERLNPGVPLLMMEAPSGKGMDAWIALLRMWLKEKRG